MDVSGLNHLNRPSVDTAKEARKSEAAAERGRTGKGAAKPDTDSVDRVETGASRHIDRAVERAHDEITRRADDVRAHRDELRARGDDPRAIRRAAVAVERRVLREPAPAPEHRDDGRDHGLEDEQAPKGKV